MTAVSTYTTGTVSVANGDTTIVGADGANWSNPNVKPGDSLVIAGNTVTVLDVTDATHLAVLPWPFTSVSAGTAYAVLQTSFRRTAGGDAMEDVAAVFSGLRTKGLYIFVDPDATVPDPSLGREDQFALQPDTGKLWLKTGGVWVFQGIYKGLSPKGPWDPGTAYNIGDIVSLAGSSYLASAQSTNQTPPNATYWQVLAAKGDGATVEVGTTTTGAPGTNADVTNSGTDADAVFNFTIPAGKGYGGTSTTSLAIGTGSKAFTTQSGLAYLAGVRVRATATAGATGWLEGVATYSGTTLTITSDKINGTGTGTAWNLNVVGEPGAGDLTSTNNLSDLASAPAARRNLGVVKTDGLIYSTNVIQFPYFNRNQWTMEGGPSDLVVERFAAPVTSVPFIWFNYRQLQIFGAAGAVTSSHPTNVGIDTSQSYRIGVWGYSAGGGNIEIVVTPTDSGGSLFTPLTLTLALTASVSGTVGEVSGVINPVGGSAPAWPTGTAGICGAQITIRNPTSGTDKRILGIYCIPVNQFPNTTFTKAQFGGGTHEGAWDGTYLYTISHTYNQVAKYDASLNRVAVANINDYPHDILILGNDLWVINYIGASLQKIDKTTMTVTNTYSLTGGLQGYGLTTDGTNLFLGAGTGGTQTPSILKFTVATSTQTLLSTDVNGGGANSPLQYLSGSIWAVDRTTSTVKRINPSTGATIASISCNVAGIYGLGNDGSLIYAVGETGVAVVDPASNTVVGRYMFRFIFGGQSNAKMDSNGCMWGTCANGVFKLDHARKSMIEFNDRLGVPKWFTRTSMGMVLGMYAFPSLDVYG